EVWDYARQNDVPTHPLYERGYTSIGCAPCTRAIAPGEAARDGRWWWETNAAKEGGIHCAIETGGFEREQHALLKGAHGSLRCGQAARRGRGGRARRGAGGALDGRRPRAARPTRRPDRRDR